MEEEEKIKENEEDKEKRKLAEDEKMSEQDSPAKKRKTEEKIQGLNFRKNTHNQEGRRNPRSQTQVKEPVTVFKPVTVRMMNPTPVTVNELRKRFEEITIETKNNKMTNHVKDPNDEVLSLDQNLRSNLKNLTFDQNLVRRIVTVFDQKKFLEERTVMNIETRREPEPCTTRQTKDLAEHFENLEKLEEKKAAGMRFVEDFSDRQCSPNTGLRTVDQAEQLEAQPPTLPGYIEDFSDKKCSPNTGLPTVDQAEQLEAQPPPPQGCIGGGTPLLMPRPAEMNTRTGKVQTTRLAQSSVVFNQVFAVERQEKLPGSEKTSTERIREPQGQHGAD